MADFSVKGVPSLAGRSMMSIADLTPEELMALIDVSIALKKSFKDKESDIAKEQPLVGKSVAMIFQKRSTRTRVSTETGMGLLGGKALFLGPTDIQLGVNECMKDTAKVLSGFNSLILARVFGHKDILELSKEAEVPVINALSDLHHPLQTLADLMTLKEHFGSLTNLTLAWVGDANNVLHDLMLGAAKLDIAIRIASPDGYAVDPSVMQLTADIAKGYGKEVFLTTDPREACKGAHVVVTDTWVSMGQEEEAQKRIADFQGYQVTSDMMSCCESNAVFLHCLPRHKEEVNDEVFYSDKSLVFPEAQNRMWTVMAVMQSMLGV